MCFWPNGTLRGQPAWTSFKDNRGWGGSSVALVARGSRCLKGAVRHYLSGTSIFIHLMYWYSGLGPGYCCDLISVVSRTNEVTRSAAQKGRRRVGKVSSWWALSCSSAMVGWKVFYLLSLAKWVMQESLFCDGSETTTGSYWLSRPPTPSTPHTARFDGRVQVLPPILSRTSKWQSLNQHPITKSTNQSDRLGFAGIP